MMHVHNRDYTAVYLRPFINFGTGLFIFLSGLLTDPNQKNWRQFYYKRVTRVIVPYVIWSLVFTYECNTWAVFLKQLFSFQCCPICYYIGVYLQFVLLTPALGWLSRSRFWNVGFLITPVFLLVRYTIIFHGSDLSRPELYCMAWFTYYYLGICMHEGVIPVRYIKSCLLLGFSLCIQFIEGNLWFQANNYLMATTQVRLSSLLTNTIFFCLLGIWILNGHDIKCNLFTKMGVILGNSSFGIYLSHVPLIYSRVNEFIPRTFPVNAIVILAISTIWISIANRLLQVLSRGNNISKMLGLR